MRDYGRIYTAFWTSPDVQSMGDDAKLLAAYLLTSQHTTIAGVFRLPDAYVSDDLGWTAQRVSKGFTELFRKGWCNRCETTKWVWIRKFLRWNAPENPNQWKAVRKVGDQLPEKCDFRSLFLDEIDALSRGEKPPEPEPLINGSETLSKHRSGSGSGSGSGTGEDPFALAREAPGLDCGAWDRWLGYRRAIKKPIREVSAVEAARDMAKLGDRQAEAVAYTMAKGWQGLRLPDKPPATAGKPMFLPNGKPNPEAWT